MSLIARFTGSARRSPLLFAGLLVLVLSATAGAQDKQPDELLEDFVHYTKTARPDLASANGQALLGSGISDAEIAVLVEESKGGVARFDEAIDRALRMEALEDIAGELGLRVEQGRKDLARNPDRIEEAVNMLVGTQRQKLLGRGRLEAAGEYAVPALLKRITDGHDDKLAQACERMIQTIGVQAVGPLCAALPNVDPASQSVVCDMLASIGYPHAAPYLLALSSDASADGPARAAAERAYPAVGGVGDDLSELYADLAIQYYDEHGSLIAFPFEATNNVWSHDAFVGLVATPVPTAVYSEIMAMGLASRAMKVNPDNRVALALFVAANLKRENELPAGETDPIYGDGAYTPEFYATVFGTQICQDVLALAIDTIDTPLIRDAIAALSQTTGGSNLFTGATRRPLLEALNYPDRRVQYEAALTLARALPETGFDGDTRVVPVLASAVRSGDQSFALVVADDDENRRQIINDLERLGFTIVGAEGSVGVLGGAIAEAIAVDLAVIRMGAPEAAKAAVEDLRRISKTSAVPALVLASGVDMPGLKRDYLGVNQVKVARVAVEAAAFESAMNELLDRAAGGRMTEAEAEAYGYEALGALKEIAISCSPAYEISDAEIALSDALDTRTGRARLLVAGILARIDSDDAQRKLFDAALTATDSEQIDLLDQVAESVKRIGDRAEPRHLTGLLDIVANSSGDTAEAAARVYGAMNMQTSEAVKLIP